jgi:hypothetical protein
MLVLPTKKKIKVNEVAINYTVSKNTERIEVEQFGKFWKAALVYSENISDGSVAKAIGDKEKKKVYEVRDNATKEIWAYQVR